MLNYTQQVRASEKWLCYMCSPEHSHVGLLEKREDWDSKLRDLFLNDHEMEYVSMQIIYIVILYMSKKLHFLLAPFAKST